MSKLLACPKEQGAKRFPALQILPNEKVHFHYVFTAKQGQCKPWEEEVGRAFKTPCLKISGLLLTGTLEVTGRRHSFTPLYIYF